MTSLTVGQRARTNDIKAVSFISVAPPAPSAFVFVHIVVYIVMMFTLCFKTLCFWCVWDNKPRESGESCIITLFESKQFQLFSSASWLQNKMQRSVETCDWCLHYMSLQGKKHTFFFFTADVSVGCWWAELELLSVWTWPRPEVSVDPGLLNAQLLLHCSPCAAIKAAHGHTDADVTAALRKQRHTGSWVYNFTSTDPQFNQRTNRESPGLLNINLKIFN